MFDEQKNAARDRRFGKLLGCRMLLVLICVLVLVPHAAHADITTNLLTHWRFEEGSGTTTADSSGNGYTGTLRNGPVWTTGRVGNYALQFDGTNDYVDATLSSVTAYPFTLAAWVRFDTPSDSFAAAIASSTSGSSYFGIGVNASSTAKSQFRPVSSAGTTISTGGGNIAGGWHQIVSVFSAANSRMLYVDGVSVATSTTNITNPFSLAHLTAGNRGGSSPTNYFNGSIDDVRFYTRALNASDVNELYSATSGDTSAPTVSVTAPTSGATLSATSTLSATTTDNIGVTGVRFYYDSTNLIGTEDPSSPFSVDWDTTAVSDGSHSVIAVARDAAGNAATSTPVTVTVDNSADTVAPAVEITAPSAGAQVGSVVTLTASSTDNRAVTGVRFMVDGGSVGTEDVAAPFTMSWDSTTVSDGSHSIQAVARDAAGNAATSSAVTITVDNTGSGITSVSADVSGTEAEITWTTDEPSTSFVEYGYTSDYLASTTVDTDLVTSHSVIVGGLIPDATYHYRVGSTDEAGNTAYSSDRTFTAGDIQIQSAAPSGSWNGTVGSGGSGPADPTRTTFKPTAHFTIPPYQDVVSDFDVPVMAFAKGGVQKVRFYVEGNTVDVNSPIRYDGHEGRPYEAYVIRLDASAFPAHDGAFRIYAEVYPNDPTAERRVISMDLWFNGGGSLTGTGVSAYVDGRADVLLDSAMSATAGNRIVGQTSGTMAIVVDDATSASTLVVSPMSLDGGTTQPQFTVGEAVVEVEPDGTPTGNTSTVAGALEYYGSTGTYPSVGTENAPFWHLKAAATAISNAGLVPYHRATYYFENGSQSLLGLTGQSNSYQYVNLVAATGAEPTIDYGLGSSFRMSLVDQHIKGFTFRRPHTFASSSTNVNYTSGSEEELVWLDGVRIEGNAANDSVMGFPANGTTDYFTDSSIENAAQGFSSSELVRNATVTHTTSDVFSHARAVINSAAYDIEQISPSHTDIYQYETQDNAENILIYGLKVLDPIVLNAGLFLTGEDGSGKGSFRDWAIVNYLSEENRDDVTNNVSHFNIWNSTMVNSSVHLGLSATTSAQHSTIRNNWIERLVFDSAAEESGWLASTVFDSNNYTTSSSEFPGTATSTLDADQSFADASENDYAPTESMPRAPRMSLLDVDGNYRAPLSAIGAVAGDDEHPEEVEEPEPEPEEPVTARRRIRSTGRRIRQAAPPVPPVQVAPSSVFVRDLSLGSSGEDVRQLQVMLNSLGFSVAQAGPGAPGMETGLFGQLTQSALMRFQQARGIVPASGYFGPITRAVVQGLSGETSTTVSETPSAASVPVPVDYGVFVRDLSLGSSGEDVRQLQAFLINRRTGPASEALGQNGITGIFGPLTRSAVAEFQRAVDISPAEGYVGPVTRAAIGR